jgi:hypothetical protein
MSDKDVANYERRACGVSGERGSVLNAPMTSDSDVWSRAQFWHQYGDMKGGYHRVRFLLLELRMSRRFTAQSSPATLSEVKFVYFLQYPTLLNLREP